LERASPNMMKSTDAFAIEKLSFVYACLYAFNQSDAPRYEYAAQTHHFGSVTIYPVS
jgi:hypothetical protein